MSDHEHVWETLEDGSKLCFECDQRMPVPALFKYSFTVKGSYPDGNKATMYGHIYDEDGTPWSAFDKAVAACQALTPELVVDRTKPGQVSLRKNKKPYPRIEVIHEPPEFKRDPQEKCCFCQQPTPYWVKGKDVACCQACATTHVLAEVPAKADWCAKNKVPHDAANN